MGRIRPTRRTQPYRAGLSRPATAAGAAMKRGRTAYGQNASDMPRLAAKRARQRRRRIR